MSTYLNEQRLQVENTVFAGTGGVSQRNRSSGFHPAFLDNETGVAVFSRWGDGSLAPMHVLEGLPKEWVVKTDTRGTVVAIKRSVVAGFIRQGQFYTRSQAAQAVAA